MASEKKVRYSRVLLDPLFFIASSLYRYGVKLRHILYDQGWMKSHFVPLPVISVGNISAGGTGKTPFTKALIREISTGPGSIAVLSRGYRSLAEHSFVLASSGQGPLVSPKICGDEPYWLALSTDASIWVGKNRLWNAKYATLSGAKALLLEDGFQHRKMERDEEIVLLHAQDLWGGGQFLPRGYLRDFPQRLKQAKWIVVTHWEEGNSSNQEDIIEQIQKYTDAPIMGLQTKYLLEEEVIRKRKIGAFCGIARPSVFYQALSSFDMQIVKKLSLKDHGTPSLRQLCVFADDCQRLGAKYLVCTEKDLVKWSEKDLDCLPLPLVPLKMEFTCTWNQNVWKEMIQSIKNKM